MNSRPEVNPYLDILRKDIEQAFGVWDFELVRPAVQTELEKLGKPRRFENPDLTERRDWLTSLLESPEPGDLLKVVTSDLVPPGLSTALLPAFLTCPTEEPWRMGRGADFCGCVLNMPIFSGASDEEVYAALGGLSRLLRWLGGRGGSPTSGVERPHNGGSVNRLSRDWRQVYDRYVWHCESQDPCGSHFWRSSRGTASGDDSRPTRGTIKPKASVWTKYELSGQNPFVDSVRERILDAFGLSPESGDFELDLKPGGLQHLPKSEALSWLPRLLTARTNSPWRIGPGVGDSCLFAIGDYRAPLAEWVFEQCTGEQKVAVAIYVWHCACCSEALAQESWDDCWAPVYEDLGHESGCKAG